MQMILKRSEKPFLLQWTKRAGAVMKGDFTPSVSHRQGGEIAGRATPWPDRLGSVKTLFFKHVDVHVYNVYSI